jgi:threonine synthase
VRGDDGWLVRAVAERARPLRGDHADLDSLVDRCDCVLIGEASHGRHELYRLRALLTRRLIVEKGFAAVAAEADWPDAYRVNRWVQGLPGDTGATAALAGFRRFPQWMWRNSDVLDFVGWLRARNEELSAERRAGFYGLDLYSLQASMDSVLPRSAIRRRSTAGPPGRTCAIEGRLTRRFRVVCGGCGADHTGRHATQCRCGWVIDVTYDPAQVRLRPSGNAYERFRDLLPVEDPAVIPAPRGEYTPCRRARELGERLGLTRLYLKDETAHPTGSTKDRSAAMSLSMHRENGVRAFATATTGNAGTAYVNAIQRFAGIRMFLFVGEAFGDRVHFGTDPRVVPFILEGGTFVEAAACAKQFAVAHGIPADDGFFNIGKREGLKLAFFEASEQIGAPIDWYVQCISSGMGAYATHIGALQLLSIGAIERPPRQLMVQEATCSPMVRAWEAGRAAIEPGDIVARPTGLAVASHRGDPTKSYPHMRRAVVESGGTFVSVTEAEIRQARTLVKELEGVDICFTASAAVAGLAREARAGRVGRDQVVMVNLTGRDRAPEVGRRQAQRLVRSAEGWTLDGVRVERAVEAA